MIALPAAEGVLDASGIAPRIGALLPSGARKRQLAVRTLLLGMMLAVADGRPAHLTRVHQALTSLPEREQRRLGVLADWENGPHLLTYRQAEYTFRLVTAALGKDQPDGLPSQELQHACDDLLEASVPAGFKDASSSLAVDWTDLESFSRPPPRGTSDCAGPEASWGHRKNNLLRDEDELFFGYYLSAAIMAPGEQGPPVPELARRMTLSSCRHDPVPAFTPVLTAMPQDGIPLGDVLADSGYSHRIPGNRAAPLRRAGAALVQDLHPGDRGPKGTHQGAIIANGNLYCPAAPRTLLELGPLARGATPEQAAQHDAKTAEAARYKLGRLTRDDEDGYHRVQCPAVAGKIRPLPAAAVIDGPGPGPPRDPHPARAPAGLLHPADTHDPAGRERENPAEARLPLRHLAPLLRPPQRSRARLRHRQGPRQQRHQPRLVPPHGTGAPHALHRHPARRPQPADPARLGRPAGRKHPPRRQGPAPENPPAPPPDDRRARQRRPNTSPATHTDPAVTTTIPETRRQHARKPAPAHRKRPPGHKTPPNGSSPGTRHTAPGNARPKREDRPH
jgi:hypothetical protein